MEWTTISVRPGGGVRLSEGLELRAPDWTVLEVMRIKDLGDFLPGSKLLWWLACPEQAHAPVWVAARADSRSSPEELCHATVLTRWQVPFGKNSTLDGFPSNTMYTAFAFLTSSS
jgi:hypothetical protein